MERSARGVHLSDILQSIMVGPNSLNSVNNNYLFHLEGWSVNILPIYRYSNKYVMFNIERIDVLNLLHFSCEEMINVRFDLF